MTREELLESLSSAKEAHLANNRRINNIIKNRAFVNRPPEAEALKCQFGKWLHSNPFVEKIVGSIFYGDLVTLHNKWHNIYLDIYYSFFDNKKLTEILEKIDQSQKEKEIEKLTEKMSKIKFKLSTLDEEKVKALQNDLEKISIQIKSTIESCERKINATSLSLFNEAMSMRT